MTKEILNMLPTTVKDHIERIRKDYKNETIDTAEIRRHAYGYTLGLRDGGLITEAQRRLLFCYCTL